MLFPKGFDFGFSELLSLSLSLDRKVPHGPTAFLIFERILLLAITSAPVIGRQNKLFPPETTSPIKLRSRLVPRGPLFFILVHPRQPPFVHSYILCVKLCVKLFLCSRHFQTRCFYPWLTIKLG